MSHVVVSFLYLYGVYYVPEALQGSIAVGDLVLCESRHGRALGTVIGDCSALITDDVSAARRGVLEQKRHEMAALLRSAAAAVDPLCPEAGARGSLPPLHLNDPSSGVAQEGTMLRLPCVIRKGANKDKKRVYYSSKRSREALESIKPLLCSIPLGGAIHAEYQVDFLCLHVILCAFRSDVSLSDSDLSQIGAQLAVPLRTDLVEFRLGHRACDLTKDIVGMALADFIDACLRAHRRPIVDLRVPQQQFPDAVSPTTPSTTSNLYGSPRLPDVSFDMPHFQPVRASTDTNSNNNNNYSRNELLPRPESYAMLPSESANSTSSYNINFCGSPTTPMFSLQTMGGTSQNFTYTQPQQQQPQQQQQQQQFVMMTQSSGLGPRMMAIDINPGSGGSGSNSNSFMPTASSSAQQNFVNMPSFFTFGPQGLQRAGPVYVSNTGIVYQDPNSDMFAQPQQQQQQQQTQQRQSQQQSASSVIKMTSGSTSNSHANGPLNFPQNVVFSNFNNSENIFNSPTNNFNNNYINNNNNNNNNSNSNNNMGGGGPTSTSSNAGEYFSNRII